jgi:hypothetical protein
MILFLSILSGVLFLICVILFLLIGKIHAKCWSCVWGGAGGRIICRKSNLVVGGDFTCKQWTAVRKGDHSLDAIVAAGQGKRDKGKEKLN